MRSMFDKANGMVGSELIIRGKSYGIVTEVFAIDEEIGLVTDSGKRLRLSSVLRALNESLRNAVYPQGTEYAQRISQPKKLYRANAFCVANIDSTARIGTETIDIAKRPGD
jgi:hypothetical protein